MLLSLCFYLVNCVRLRSLSDEGRVRNITAYPAQAAVAINEARGKRTYLFSKKISYSH